MWYLQFLAYDISFTYVYLFYKFYQSNLSGLKVSLLAAPFEEDPLIFLFPSFVKFYLLFMFASPENFMCLA